MEYDENKLNITNHAVEQFVSRCRDENITDKEEAGLIIMTYLKTAEFFNKQGEGYVYYDEDSDWCFVMKHKKSEHIVVTCYHPDEEEFVEVAPLCVRRNTKRGKRTKVWHKFRQYLLGRKID